MTRRLPVSDKHLIKIANQMLRMSDFGARLVGGMTKKEARLIISRLVRKNS